MGISYTRQDPAGWSAGFTLGRILRADPVDEFASGTGLDGRWSDYVAAVSVDFAWGLTAINRALFDTGLGFRRNEFALAYDGAFGALRAAYVYLAENDSDPVLGPQPETSEISLDARYRVRPNWELRGLWRYDVASRSNLRAGAGITYGNECAEFDLSVSRRYTSSDNVPPSTSIGFSLRLAGIGEKGQEDWPARVCMRGILTGGLEGVCGCGGCSLFSLASLALAAPALAQNPYAPAIMVNEGVITHYDIDQRIRLLEALGANGDLRKLAVQQLTEDRVKVQAAGAMEIELPEGAIEAGIEEFATGRGLTMDDVQLALDARGIDQQTLDDFVESGLLWRDVIGDAVPRPRDADRGRPRRRARDRRQHAAGDADAGRDRAPLRRARPARDRRARRAHLPPGRRRRELRRAGAPVQPQRHRRARRRARPASPPPTCRPPSAPRCCSCGPGQVARPLPISGGVAIIKLVSIRQVPPQPIDADDPEVREALRQRLFAERITSFGQGYLQELLGDAIIVDR